METSMMETWLMTKASDSAEGPRPEGGRWVGSRVKCLLLVSNLLLALSDIG